MSPPPAQNSIDFDETDWATASEALALRLWEAELARNWGLKSQQNYTALQSFQFWQTSIYQKKNVPSENSQVCLQLGEEGKEVYSFPPAFQSKRPERWSHYISKDWVMGNWIKTISLKGSGGGFQWSELYRHGLSLPCCCLFQGWDGAVSGKALPAPSWTPPRGILVEVGLGWKLPVTILVVVVDLFAACTFGYKDFLTMWKFFINWVI